MQDKQTTTTLPPKVSIFDKKGQANMSRFTKLPNTPNNQSKVIVQPVRINQHKGA